MYIVTGVKHFEKIQYNHHKQCYHQVILIGRDNVFNDEAICVRGRLKRAVPDYSAKYSKVMSS